MSCNVADITICWEGKGLNGVGIDATSGKTMLRVNPKHYRPAEVDSTVGSPKKAFKELVWKAETSVERRCEIMMEAVLRSNGNAQKIFVPGSKHHDGGKWLIQESLAANCNSKAP